MDTDGDFDSLMTRKITKTFIIVVNACGYSSYCILSTIFIFIMVVQKILSSNFVRYNMENLVKLTFYNIWRKTGRINIFEDTSW